MMIREQIKIRYIDITQCIPSSLYHNGKLFTVYLPVAIRSTTLDIKTTKRGNWVSSNVWPAISIVLDSIGASVVSGFASSTPTSSSTIPSLSGWTSLMLQFLFAFAVSIVSTKISTIGLEYYSVNFFM